MPSEALLPFITLEREVLQDCRIFRVSRVRRQSRKTGASYDYFCIDAPEWVNVIALTPREELVLVRQERHGLGAFTLELPAGLVEPGEDPRLAASRELREETGFTSAAMESLGFVHPNPAVQGNRCHIFLARNVQPGEAAPDHLEEIELVLVPFARVRELILRGEITHSLVLAALYLYDLKAGAVPPN